MRHAVLASLIVFALTFAGGANAADAQLDVSEATLNRMVDRVGVLSDGGVGQPLLISQVPGVFMTCHPIGFMDCPGLDMIDLGINGGRIHMAVCEKVGGGIAVVPIGDPVPWQWWITDARFTINDGSMSFTATVKTHIADEWRETTRTVPASIRFDGASNKLMIVIDPFRVGLSLENSGSGPYPLDVAAVDVGKNLGLAVPIVPQQLSVPLPGGQMRNVSGRVTSATAIYSSGNLKVNFNVAF